MRFCYQQGLTRLVLAKTLLIFVKKKYIMHFFSLLLQKKKVGFVFNYKKKDITCIFSSFFVSCNFCQFCSFSCNFSSFLSCKKKLNSLNHSPTLNWELFPLSKKKVTWKPALQDELTSFGQSMSAPAIQSLYLGK